TDAHAFRHTFRFAEALKRGEAPASISRAHPYACVHDDEPKPALPTPAAHQNTSALVGIAQSVGKQVAHDALKNFEISQDKAVYPLIAQGNQSWLRPLTKLLYDGHQDGVQTDSVQLRLLCTGNLSH